MTRKEVSPMKFKYVGSVTDESYYEAWSESNFLDCIEQIKKDYMEIVLKQNFNWMMRK